MTNHMYILNLETLVWQQHICSPDSEKPPTPRYFHTATAYRHFIIYFGGMKINNNNNKSSSTITTNVLSDLYLFNTHDLTWIKKKCIPNLFTPKPRYAHVAMLLKTKDQLLILGGQDENNDTVLEFNILNLLTFDWIQGGTLHSPSGIYRTVPFEPSLSHLNFQQHNIHNATSPSSSSPSSPSSSSSSSSSHSPWNKKDIYLFSNYNFTSKTKRELQSFDPSQPTNPHHDHMKDLSHLLFDGINHNLQQLQHEFQPSELLPPGLRFPQGEVIGQYLLISGTHVGGTETASIPSIQLWAFHLLNHTWTKIETGTKLTTGSWNRGILYENQWYYFGNQERELVMDYNQRQMNFNDIAVVQLEAFGVYQSPLITCDNLGCELGLSMLNEPNMADVYVITSDQQCIAANSHILCLRWPLAVKLFSNYEKVLLQQHDSSPSQHQNKKSIKDKFALSSSSSSSVTTTKYQRGIHKSLLFPENYSVALAFLQYIYTDHLITAQQLQPTILSRLLVLADMYDIARLKRLALHALHQTLTVSTASLVYEAATLTNQAPLQIRALRVMINAKKVLDKQPSHHAHHSITQPINIQSNKIKQLPTSSKSIPPPPSPAPTYHLPNIPSSSLPNTPYLLQDQDHFITSTFSPTSPPPPSQQYYNQQQRFSVATSSTTGTKIIKSPRSFSSSSSSSSSIDESYAPRTPHGSFSKEKEKESGGKFNWRRLQQTTVALAKPKPLRTTAAGHQPFSDL
ncbi:unnamed protein product [Cunninghamella echinulata]